MEKDLATFTAITSRLERTIVDPEVESILSELSFLEEQYNVGLATDHQLSARLTKINHKWPHKDEKVHVTGEVKVNNHGHMDSRIINEKVMSIGVAGFKYVNNFGKPQYSLGYNFALFDRAGEVSRAFAGPDMVAVDYSEPSAALSKKYLEYFEPNLKQGSDTLFERYKGSKTTRVLALRAFALHSISADESSKDKIKYLTKYLNSKIHLDSEPYKVEFDGNFYRTINSEEGANMETLNSGKYMARLSALNIRLTRKARSAQPNALKPVFTLTGQLMNENADYASSDFEAPLTSVKNLSSCRDIIYDNNSPCDTSQTG